MSFILFLSLFVVGYFSLSFLARDIISALSFPSVFGFIAVFSCRSGCLPNPARPAPAAVPLSDAIRAFRLFVFSSCFFFPPK